MKNLKYTLCRKFHFKHV